MLAILMDLTFTYLSENESDSPVYKAALDILVEHVEHPDPGSKFEQVVCSLGNCSPKAKIAKLLPQGFDALLGLQNETIVSFLALKRRTAQRPLGVFRVYTVPEYRNNGVATRTVAHLVSDCFEKGHEQIYVSEGNHPGVVAVLRSVQRTYQGHAIEVQPEKGLIKRL